jgi:hypothetical protein
LGSSLFSRVRFFRLGRTGIVNTLAILYESAGSDCSEYTV